MKRYLIVLTVLLALSPVYSQNSIDLFPNSLLINPFTANTLEPKLGFLFHSSENELRLDIGNSLDILHYHTPSAVYSFGADLFTYTRLRKEENFHFPVDAVDYLFGVNFGYKKEFEDFEIGARLRLSHISTHMADGHYDNVTLTWRDNHPPRVYSREFFELMPYIRHKTFRGYAGFTYIFHIDPEYIKKDNYQIGFDYFIPWFNWYLLTPYIGYDLKIIHLNSYTANNSIVAGIKIGRQFGKGINIYYQYYAGNSVHGQYFESKVAYSAIGINLDL